MSGPTRTPSERTTQLVMGEAIRHDLTGISHLSLGFMKNLMHERSRLSQGRPTSVIMVAPDVLTIDFEVQLVASDVEVQRLTRAMAIVGDSFMLRHLTSMFLSYHAPAYPVQRFSCEQDALRWLDLTSAKMLQPEC